MAHADRRCEDDGLDASPNLLRRRFGIRTEEHHLGRGPWPRGRGLDRQAVERRGHQRPSFTRGRCHRPEDGHPRVELRQRNHARQALPGAAARQGGGAARHQGGGGARLRPQARPRRGLSLSQLRRADRVRLVAVHRMRRLRRHLPDGLHYVHAEWRGGRPARAAPGAGREPHARPLYRQRAQDRPGHGEGRGRVPALRAVRRAVPDRRLGYAEIPSGHDLRGTRMPLKSENDFVVRFVTVNIFPSNIQGLPTWYEVRVSEAGHLGARGGVDLMVAMNPQTWDKDVASIEPGGYLFYDSTKPLPASKFREDITVIGVPLTAIANREYTDPRQRQLFKNIIYVGALAALLDMDVDEIQKLFGEQFKGKEKLIEPNIHALKLGRDWALENLKCPLGIRLKRSDAVGDRIFIEGNSAAALGAVYGGATVCAWYPITPSSSLADAFTSHCKKLRHDPKTGKANYAIVQGEDELASIRIVIGASWNGARAFTATSGPGISLMQEFIGLSYFAEIPAVI